MGRYKTFVLALLANTTLLLFAIANIESEGEHICDHPDPFADKVSTRINLDKAADVIITRYVYTGYGLGF